MNNWVQHNQGSPQTITGDEEHSLRQYFVDVADAATKPLSRAEEAVLGVKIQCGDQEARNALVRANLRFVVNVAKRYQNRGLSLADLISAGNLGLMTAAERFDASKGHKFISYAVWWIRQAILQAIAEHARTVRLPLNKINLLKDITETARRLGQGRQVEPLMEEIAEALEVDVSDVADTLLSMRTVYSLDQEFEMGTGTLQDVLADTRQEKPDDRVWRACAREQLDAALDTLNERERCIIRLYYGFDTDEMLTLEKIGSMLNLTRERVRQLKESGFNKLRHPTRIHFLKGLAEDSVY